MSKKYVYLFSEGDASMRNLLGGKGANLAEMTKIGMLYKIFITMHIEERIVSILNLFINQSQ